MSTYTQILYHIVFATKNRTQCISPEKEEHLFKYIWGIVQNHQSRLYRINGTADHIHLAVSLHQSVAVADLVKTMKVSSTKFIREQQLFAGFPGWQEGYGAFTLSFKEKDRLVEYIKGQKEHHREVTFLEEYRELLHEHGVEIREEYFP